MTMKTTTITISKTDGKYSSDEALKTFSWIDSDMERYGCSHDDRETPEIIVEYGKMERNGTLVDLFGTEPKCFTKAQVIEVVKSNPDIIEEYCSGFFPYANEKGEHFVLRVYRYDSEWVLYVYRLEYGSVWRAEYGHVLFLPQPDALTPETSGALYLEPLGSLTDDIAIEYLKNKGYDIMKKY